MLKYPSSRPAPTGSSWRNAAPWSAGLACPGLADPLPRRAETTPWRIHLGGSSRPSRAQRPQKNAPDLEAPGTARCWHYKWHRHPVPRLRGQRRACVLLVTNSTTRKQRTQEPELFAKRGFGYSMWKPTEDIFLSEFGDPILIFYLYHQLHKCQEGNSSLMKIKILTRRSLTEKRNYKQGDN